MVSEPSDAIAARHMGMKTHQNETVIAHVAGCAKNNPSTQYNTADTTASNTPTPAAERFQVDTNRLSQNTGRLRSHPISIAALRTTKSAPIVPSNAAGSSEASIISPPGRSIASLATVAQTRNVKPENANR